MPEAIGIATAAIQLGVDAILVKPKRAIGPFTAHVTISEAHTDELEITDQPVEQGAAISDHSFMRPSEVIIEAAWSNSPQAPNILASVANAVTGTINGVQSILTGNSQDQIRDTYAKLLALQNGRVPFDVFTGKRQYSNMLIKTLAVKTDKENENVLRVTATLRQVLIATTQILTISAPQENQLTPQSTAPTVPKGMKQLAQAQSFNPAAALRAGITASVGQIANSVSSVVQGTLTASQSAISSLNSAAGLTGGTVP